MARQANVLAKLTRPRLHGAANRSRLFSRLDECRRHKPAVCVVGPPGAGKTTLVATWLDARKVPGLWYQVDPGDTDVATFFYYLGQAAAPYAKKARRKLPVLAPEYQHDVEGFSRRFFRELFALLPEGSALVLDNYQEVEAGQLLHKLVAQAVSEIPAKIVLMAVSRRDPPDCYARLVANERVGFIDWDDLKLSLDEARTIIKARLPEINDAEIERLFKESDGWAAGLTLIIDSNSKLGSQRADVPIERNSIFSYFATQIFEQLPVTTREFLVSTAIPPQLQVSLARDLTGNPHAATILEEMYKRHFFTHRRPGTEPTYWYHALFRTFLRSKAEDVLTHEAFMETERKAARLLEARHEYDDAFQLFHEAHDWRAARRLIERHAKTLLAQGRGQTLREWVLMLPAGIIDDAPWLRYWLGVSLIPIDQAQARAHLERAFGQFAASNELNGQALSAAGIIDSYFFEWSDFRPMGRWVDTLASLHERIGFQTDLISEQKFYSSLLVGMLYVAPDHRLLPRVVERVTEMLDEEMDVNSKVSMAMVLLSYANITCDMDRGKIAIARAQPLLENQDLTPFNKLWWHLRTGFHYPVMGQYDNGIEALDLAASISEAHGLHGLRRTFLLIASYQISNFSMFGNLSEARKWHERMVRMAAPDRPMDVWHITQSKVHIECITGNYQAVVEGAREAIEKAVIVGMRYIEILGVEHEVTGLAVLGETRALADGLSRLRRMIAGTCFEFLECQAKLLEAYAAQVHGVNLTAERDPLTAALAFSKAHTFYYSQMARYSSVTGALLAEALRRSTETQYVVDTIQRFGIRPPIDAPAAWPWPVKIHALGRFEVELDGQRLEFTGKAPRRVLALLKAIVAGGPAPLSASHLVDSLWPDEEGDAGRKALEVCLVRLRKLVGHTEAVLVRDEQISLNRSLCWVDAWAFTNLVEAIESGDESPRASARLGTHALDLYRGNLLPADGENRTVIVARLKLRDLLARLVSRLGQEMEAEGRWDEALACYRRGIDADELAEEFYQGVMRCHAATGRSAEGIATYRRLRQTLSVVLGLTPSTQTEQLVQLLREERGRPQA